MTESKKILTGWGETEVKYLTDNWGKLSAAEIAAELNARFHDNNPLRKRNSVIGRVHRMKLARKGVAGGELAGLAAKIRKRSRKTKPPKMSEEAKAVRMAEARQMMTTIAQGEQLDAKIPVEQRRTVMTITSGHCRWPVGDPRSKDFFFCGAETSKTYCPHHDERSQPRLTEGDRNVRQNYARNLAKKFGAFT